MAGSTLSHSLDEAELEQIPHEVKDKLDQLLASKTEEVNQLKSKYEKLRVNSEQQYFDIEKQLMTCNGNLEAEVSQRNSLKAQLTELETKHADATKQLKELQENRDLFQNSEHEYKSSIQILENEKRDLSIIANKRSKEIDRLNEEIAQLNKRVNAANNEKCEAQAKLSELQSQEVSREFREKRLEKEKEQMEKQIEWLNKELTEKTNQLSHVRKEKTSHVLDIQSQLETKTQELTRLQAVVDSLKEAAQEQNKRMESLNQKLKDERDGQVQLEEQFRQELAVQKRLIDLYKVSAEESDEKINELTGAVDELRKLLKEASAAYTDLEASRQQEVHKLEILAAEKDEAIAKLTQELKNANDLMTALKKGAVTLSEDAVASLSPSAAATSKLLKSGMSLTQIYNEYVQAMDALGDEREENKKLTSYLEQILQEIEEKAPLLKKQREDYETALISLDQMTSQLDSAMLECEKLRTDADDMRRRYGLIQRECNKYQQSAQDLGRQVHFLLKEVEELRGGRVVREELDVSSTEVSSSSTIITEKLVTFRNIEELQQQNQRLLEVCRELSDKKEQEEREATSERTRELKEQLDAVLLEVEHLKDARSRQAEMVEAIIRQRDMYRVLLQHGSSPSEITAVAPVTSTPVQPVLKGTAATQDKSALEASRKELQDTQNALKELRAEFDAYKKDKADNDKLQNETLEKAQHSLSEMRVANTKLSTQLEYATERYKIIQDNAAGYKKEIDLLQERSHKSAAMILKLESSVAHFKEELMGAQENVARWQVQVENLKAEKELLKNSEKRLIMELDNMRREQTSQSLLMASLQAIQNNQERAEFETRVQHKNQVDGLEREIANLRRRLEASLEEKTKQATTWEDIVKSVHLELKHEKDKQASLQSKYENTRLELDTARQELSACEAKLAATETKLEKLYSQQSRATDDESTSVEARVDTEAVKDLKNQLTQQQILIKNLRQQVEAARKHANQYKTIADSIEQNLKEQAQASKEVQEACEKKVHEAHTEKETVLKRLELLEKDYEAALAENVRLSTDSSSLHGDLRKQLSSLQNELEEAVSQKNSAIAKCEAALSDCKKQADVASEAQDKYQRELMLHAADVEALTAVKKQFEDMQEHLQQSQEETIIYEKQLTDAKTSWSEQERVYKEEIKMLETRCDELTKQNRTLHEQMTKLSSQVASIQQTSRQQPGATVSASVRDEQGKTSEQLLEVIRFLRREKEIAETKLQVVQTECTRIKHRHTSLEKQLEEVSKNLAEERQRSQVHAETVANQVELMRKVSHLNVLTDSNKLLRDERDQLVNSRQELESKIRKLESEIEPLQKGFRELESQKDTLTVERNVLQEEVNRWKNRTSNLIEQSNKTDPEEHKRLIQEKENIRRQLAQAKEDNFKLRAEVGRLTNTVTGLQTELSNLRQEATKTSQERDSLKKELEDKSKESDEKTTTINSLKQIGRKYKKMAEEVTKELDDLKAKVAGQDTDKMIAELRHTVTEQTASLSLLESQLSQAQNEAQAAIKRVEQTQIENNGLKENFRGKEQELADSQASCSKLKAEIEELQKKPVEVEKKLAQSRQVLQNARNKMMIQKAQLEKLEAENKELKESTLVAQHNLTTDSDQMKSLKAQYEARLAEHEKELRELRAAASSQASSENLIEKFQQENAELQAKVQQLQRQLEAAQHKPAPPQQPVAARPASSVGSSTASSDAPKTANIKPMATAVSTSRQNVPIASHSPAAAKATASIRPMAISPTATSLPPSGTPTATVMPTTVSQHDPSEDNMPGQSGLQQSVSTASVSGRVQIVEPQVAGERSQDTSDSIETTEEGLSSQTVVIPSPQDTVMHVVNPTMAVPATPADVLPQQHTTGIALGKRAREDDSQPPVDESDSKRSRINSQDHQIPTITVIDENQQVVTQIQPQTSTSGQSKPAAATAFITTAPATSLSATASATKDRSEAIPQLQHEEAAVSAQEVAIRQQTDDVIMVLSDEDDQATGEGGGHLEDEGEEEEEDYEDDDDDEDEDDEDEDIEEAEDGDDVVIIDMDESQSVSHGASLPRPPPPLQPIAHTERLPSVGRSQQLTPFLLAAQGSMFEEEDCTVPSTPTLSQPRRADGFAEALNSPAVPQRFVFGSEGGNSPALAELESQRALGMDDTKMDLSQYDVAGSHSIPTTPTPQTHGTESRSLEAGTGLSESTSLEGRLGEEELEHPQDSVRLEGENQEQEDALLDGDGDHEVAAHEEDQQTSGDVQGRPGISRDDADSSQDKSEGAARPQIKKIVWDASESSTSSSAVSGVSPISTVVGGTVTTPLTVPQQQPPRRAQGLRRGGPTRARGSPFWPQANPSRGGSPFNVRGRGSRGGFRGY
ncbi:hypothetical protein BsWGS_02600 [Bradybaena similaris]